MVLKGLFLDGSSRLPVNQTRSWYVGIANEPLPSFGVNLLPVSCFITALLPLSNANIWFTTLNAPDLFAKFLAYSLCQSTAVEWGK